MKDPFWIAVQATFGVVAAAGFIGLVVGLIHGVFGSGLDATDKDSWSRSGAKLITDYGTGCQYLSEGGITPRLDRDGKHICGESK